MRKFRKCRASCTRACAIDNRTAHIAGSCSLASFYSQILGIKDDWSFSFTLCISEVSEFQLGFPAASANDKQQFFFFLEHSTGNLIWRQSIDGRMWLSSRFKMKCCVLWCGKLIWLVFKVHVIASHSTALKEGPSSFHDYLSSTIHRLESRI